MSDDVKSWPFSSYDFFGYLMPGLLFTISLFGWLIYAKFSFAIEIWSKITGVSEPGPSVLFVLLSLAIFYFIGHIIGSISHILYDRIVVRTIIGYPLQYNLSNNNGPRKNVRNTYIAILLVFFFFLILPALFSTYIKIWQQGIAGTINDDNLVIIEKYFRSFSSVSLLIIIFLEIHFLKKRFKTFNPRKKKSFFQRISVPLKKIKATKWIFTTLIFLENKIFKFVKYQMLKPLRKVTSTDSKVDTVIAKKFSNNVKILFEIEADTDKSDAFWLSSIKMLENKDITRRLNNWLNLYGYLRNYSCSFLLLSSIIAVYHWYVALTEGFFNGVDGIRILLASIVISFLLFLRYWIIYYSYFTKYLIRAFAYYKNPDQQGI